MTKEPIHTYDIRCHERGSLCVQHGARVRAATPRDALARIVNPDWFGPLHRARRETGSLDRIAYIATAGGFHPDTAHGAIYVRQVGETR